MILIRFSDFINICLYRDGTVIRMSTENVNVDSSNSSANPEVHKILFRFSSINVVAKGSQLRVCVFSV